MARGPIPEFESSHPNEPVLSLYAMSPPRELWRSCRHLAGSVRLDGIVRMMADAAFDRCRLDRSHASSRALLLEAASGFTSLVWAPTIPVISRAPRWNVAKFQAQFTITSRRFLKPIRK